MRSLTTFLFVVFVAILVAGGIFLVTWDIPAPTQRVEVVIPNDRFED